MTTREAAVVSAYTGIMIGEFSSMHGYIEELLGRPVFTHELGNKDFFNKIKELSKKEFLEISGNVK